LSNHSTNQFSTSARAFLPVGTESEDKKPKSSSKPYQSTDTLPADQNPHLKHTPKGSDGPSAKGNASANPSLPSKNSTNSPASASSSVRGFSTTSFQAYPTDPTGTANSEGDAATKPMDKQSSSPLGEKGGNAGTPQVNSGETQASKDMPTGTNAPDPGIPKDQAMNAKKGMTHSSTRQFSTTSFNRFPTDPTGTANSQGDAAKKPMDKQSASPLGEKGGNAGTPQVNTGETQASKDMPSGTNAPDPEISQKDSEAASKGMLSGGDKAVRRYSTVAVGMGMRMRGVRGYAANPPGGYAKAYKGEGHEAGHVSIE
jgi:hypothetical protein